MTNADTLAGAKRQAAIDQVLVNARVLVMERGLDVTMDDIADASGVARRTLFRYFESRERLVAAALATGIRRYGDVLPDFDAAANDWRAWLSDLCRAAHRMQATYGAGYWEM